jgi:hypothetical protein
MIFEAISNVLMNLLKQFLTFFFFFVIDSDLNEPLDNSAKQVKKIDVVHGEYSRSWLSSMRICSIKTRRSDMPTEFKKLEDGY